MRNCGDRLTELFEAGVGVVTQACVELPFGDLVYLCKVIHIPVPLLGSSLHLVVHRDEKRDASRCFLVTVAAKLFSASPKSSNSCRVKGEYPGLRAYFPNLALVLRYFHILRPEVASALVQTRTSPKLWKQSSRRSFQPGRTRIFR